MIMKRSRHLRDEMSICWDKALRLHDEVCVYVHAFIEIRDEYKYNSNLNNDIQIIKNVIKEHILLLQQLPNSYDTVISFIKI